MDQTNTCRRHHMEIQEDVCDACGDGYCARCLVYVWGAAKPPLCTRCALVRAGVRPGGHTPKRGWRERRRHRHLRKQARRAVQEATEERIRASAEGEPEPVAWDAEHRRAPVGAWATTDEQVWDFHAR